MGPEFRGFPHDAELMKEFFCLIRLAILDFRVFLVTNTKKEGGGEDESQ